ncbi:MAG: glycine cleavage system aminomethyltransferase GcvT [bacterium]
MKNNKRTELYPLHIRNNARMSSFAGYDMPLWYKGVKEEHQSVRKHCGIFDVSHMGIVYVEGVNISKNLQTLCSNRLNKTKQTYSMILNEEGQILDDCMITYVTTNKWLLIINASNREKIIHWLHQKLPPENTVTEYNDTHSLIAIQGPKSATILSKTIQHELTTHKSMTLNHYAYKNKALWISRSGYTGEDGFEILIENDLAKEFWESCNTYGATNCGLTSRDILRLEKGFPLYGHELSEEITPLETHYAWVVKWDHSYIGKKTLLKQKEDGPKTKIIALELEEPKIARQGYPVLSNNEKIGTVTSGTLSPSSNKSIALARIKNQSYTNISIQIRKDKIKAKETQLPFV